MQQQSGLVDTVIDGYGDEQATVLDAEHWSVMVVQTVVLGWTLAQPHER